MKYFDISTIISPDTVTWDNESPPRIQWHRSISGGDYVNISSININTHSGTHVDAPYHFLEAGKKIHQLNLSIFMGEALVVEILEKTITASILESSGIPRTDRILLKTGSSRLYKTKKFNTDFSALDESGARWMVERGVRLVGIEYLSIEHHGQSSHRVHHLL
ncbi:MAG: cyclase family protein, partial [Candidatus Aminicenantes bacterium]|nr:cyclase family protein [Candidatus Aminicenantes bacterium]